MDLGLQGRTAIVCGASSGIGLAVAEALAEEGANVAMFARRGDTLEQEAERLGALAVPGDATSARDLERLVEQTVGAFHGVDVLVWNGGGPPPGPAEHLTVEAVEDAVKLLLLPPVLLMRLCQPYLERGGAGRVIAITSIAAKEPTPNLGLSNILRPAVTGWAKSLSRELGAKGITVNCVAPGRIATARLEEVFPAGPTPEELRSIPAGRWGTPRELADVVCFLASDRARYVSGVTIPVDGGLDLSLF
jgi:3-oxoacyl-[acyl-carrier protein] reductase